MATFTLTADLDKLDGSPSAGTFVIHPNTRLGGRVYDDAQTFTADDGTLAAILPAADTPPYVFGFVVRRVGTGQCWKVPTQAAGITVDLAAYSETTPLPMPPGVGQLITELNGRVDDLEANGGGVSSVAGLTGDVGAVPLAAVLAPLLGDGSGSLAVVHDQDIPLATWTVPNPLGRRPTVAVYVGDSEVIADVDATTTQITITHLSPVTGQVILT